MSSSRRTSSSSGSQSRRSNGGSGIFDGSMVMGSMGAGGEEGMAGAEEGPSEPPRRSISVGRSLEADMPADVLMDFIVEKLKLLNYEREFCRRKRPHWSPLNRLYFAIPSVNPNEQFFYFTSLVAWMLGIIGRKFAPPGQFDDPNATCANILMELKELGFAAPTWPPAKLKQGHGDAICGVLDNLASYVLEQQRFAFRPAVHLPESYAEEAEVDVAADAADVTDEMYLPPLEEEEPFMEGSMREGDAGEDHETISMLESKVDPNEWKLELERVTPLLRVMMVADVKDWRTHLEQAKHLHQEIAVNLPDSKLQLERVEGEVSSALEKLGTREKVINSQFEHLAQEYRAARDRLADVEERYNKSMGNVSELTAELARVSEELEKVKHVMDERGNDISDASPLVKIKSGIHRLKDELRKMEVRIGVVEHTLLQVSIKQKDKVPQNKAYHSDMYDNLDGF